MLGPVANTLTLRPQLPPGTSGAEGNRLSGTLRVWQEEAISLALQVELIGYTDLSHIMALVIVQGMWHQWDIIHIL